MKTRSYSEYFTPELKEQGETMAKKTVIDSKLLDTIDDHIYKHLPMDKLKSMIQEQIDKTVEKIRIDLNNKINSRLDINEHHVSK